MLPFRAGSFDAVVAWTVFSSIPRESVAQRIASEVERVLRPEGVVLWYDMRVPNPRNRETVAVTRGDVHRLFPRFAVDVEPATVLPPLARHLGGATDRVYPIACHLPGVSSHLVGILRKP
jgi:ubiquinone/menaquinone biosynthesis C-methylase UbiE